MKRIWIFFAALMMGSSSAVAGGFEQPNASAAAAGVSNAFAATASDASALVYNPAAIAWLPGVTVTAGVFLDYRDSSVKTATLHAPNNGTEPLAGSLFATWAPRDSRLAAGFGFAPMYQVNNDWSVAFPATAGITKLTTDHATADLVYAINSSLAIGVGGDWYINRITMSQGPNNTFQGNDFASFGGHASLMWKPLRAWNVGLMFRSGATVDVSGQANDTLKFKLPDQATVAISHDFADVWRLETDVKWTRWSVLKDMNVVTGGVITQANTMNLQDTFTVMTGLTWTWRENSQVRIGYAYDQGANKMAGFNPVIADQDGHRISLGAGGDIYGMHLDIAYQYTLYSKTQATGTYAGSYRDRRQTLLLSVSKIFD